MLKAVLAATAAVVIAGSTLVFIQSDGRAEGSRRAGPSIDDIQAYQAARLAALRAGLMLNQEQSRHWPAFEAAMQELQKLRVKQITARRDARTGGQPQTADPAEIMRRRAMRLSENGAVLQKLADAMDPLYRSLDEAQKRRFARLAQMGPPRGQQWRGQQWRDPRGKQWRGKNRDRGSPGGDESDEPENRGVPGGKRTEAPVDLMPFVESLTLTQEIPSGRRMTAPDSF